MFPRLLYVGDVPVEASYHGSALLHRLLSDYPHDRLTVIETATESDPNRRLSGVNYISHPIGKARWLNTRYHPYVVAWFTQAGERQAPKILQSVNGAGFESVLTVAHGFGPLQLNRIIAYADVENRGSRRVLEKIGMRVWGSEMRTVHGEGRLYIRYEIKRADWAAHRK